MRKDSSKSNQKYLNLFETALSFLRKQESRNLCLTVGNSFWIPACAGMTRFPDQC